MNNDVKKNENRVFRVDQFKVPAAVLAEFTERAQAAHQRLRALPGFVEDRLLASPGEDGRTKVVTVVVWIDAAAFDAAKAAMQKHYSEMGYDPGEALKRLGIEADMAAYTELRNEWSENSAATAVERNELLWFSIKSVRMGSPPCCEVPDAKRCG